MTKQKPAWVAFGAQVNTTESTFDQPVSGYALGEGFHEEVTIEAVEPKFTNTYSAMILTWGKNGETKNDMVFFLDRENNFSAQYLRLAYALGTDVPVVKKFFAEAAPNNPTLFNGLVGMKANLMIGHRKVREFDKMFKILNLGEMYKVVDAFDNETVPEGLEDSYADYASAKAACEDNGLQLSYLNVLRISPVTNVEILEEQNIKLQELMTVKEEAKNLDSVKF